MGRPQQRYRAQGCTNTAAASLVLLLSTFVPFALQHRLPGLLPWLYCLHLSHYSPRDCTSLRPPVSLHGFFLHASHLVASLSRASFAAVFLSSGRSDVPDFLAFSLSPLLSPFSHSLALAALSTPTSAPIDPRHFTTPSRLSHRLGRLASKKVCVCVCVCLCALSFSGARYAASPRVVLL